MFSSEEPQRSETMENTQHEEVDFSKLLDKAFSALGLGEGISPEDSDVIAALNTAMFLERVLFSKTKFLILNYKLMGKFAITFANDLVSDCYRLSDFINESRNEIVKLAEKPEGDNSDV